MAACWILGPELVSRVEDLWTLEDCLLERMRERESVQAWRDLEQEEGHP